MIEKAFRLFAGEIGSKVQHFNTRQTKAGDGANM